MVGLITTVVVWVWLTALPCHVLAEGKTDWHLLRDGIRVSYLLDMANLERKGPGFHKVRIRRLFKDPGERAYAEDTLEIDCRNDLYRFSDVILYDREDDVVNRYRLTDDFAFIPPASYIAEARKLICPAADND